MKRRRCENCVIGVLTGDGSGQLMTFPSLLKHIERQQELNEMLSAEKTKVITDGMLRKPVQVFSVEDYLEGRKQTDMFRFSCCPICGHTLNFRDMFDKYIDNLV